METGLLPNIWLKLVWLKSTLLWWCSYVSVCEQCHWNLNNLTPFNIHNKLLNGWPTWFLQEIARQWKCFWNAEYVTVINEDPLTNHKATRVRAHKSIHTFKCDLRFERATDTRSFEKYSKYTRYHGCRLFLWNCTYTKLDWCDLLDAHVLEPNRPTTRESVPLLVYYYLIFKCIFQWIYCHIVM